MSLSIFYTKIYSFFPRLSLKARRTHKRPSIKPGTWNITEHPETSNNYDNYEEKCVYLNRGLTHVTIWSAQIDQVTLWFLLAGRTTLPRNKCVRMNCPRGKSIEKYMRSLIIDDILSGGGDVTTECYPGSFRAIGSKYKVSGVTVSNVWKTFCQTGENLPLHAAARGQPKRLTEPELRFDPASDKM